MNPSLALFVAMIKRLRRYPGWLFMDMFWPFLVVAFPLLIGISITGSYRQAIQNFVSRMPGVNPLSFLVLGAASMSLISEALWRFGTYIRWEQRQGTLESLLLAPVRTRTIAFGVSLYSLFRGLSAFFGFIVISSLVLHLGLLNFRLVPALGVILLGILPVFGMSMLLGMLILWLKEIGNVVSMVEWTLYLVSGVVYPVWFLPPTVRLISMLLPSTWLVNDVRAVVMGTRALLGSPLFDLFAIAVMGALWMALGEGGFDFVLGRLKERGGVSGF